MSPISPRRSTPFVRKSTRGLTLSSLKRHGESSAAPNALLTDRVGSLSRRHLELLWKGIDVLFDR